MIRKETLRSYLSWAKPNKNEIDEVIIATGYGEEELSTMMGISKVTLQRWRMGKVDIPYANWALLCYLTGNGDIIEDESKLTNLNKKMNRARKYFIQYSSSVKEKESEILQR